MTSLSASRRIFLRIVMTSIILSLVNAMWGLGSGVRLFVARACDSWAHSRHLEWHARTMGDGKVWGGAQ